MTHDTDIRTYFNTHAPRAAPGEPSPVVRAVNAVLRARVETMDELLAKTPEELTRIRNAGAKSLELIYLMRDKYAQETGKTQQDSLKEDLSK
jgi:DNA-directed RNA polymerase alpha subunit